MFRSITTVSTMAVGAFAMEDSALDSTLASGSLGSESTYAGPEMEASMKEMKDMLSSIPAMEKGDLAPFKTSMAKNLAMAELKRVSEGAESDSKQILKNIHAKRQVAELVAALPNHVGPDNVEGVLRHFADNMIELMPSDQQTVMKRMMAAVEQGEGGLKNMLEKMLSQMTPEQKEQFEAMQKQMMSQQKAD